MSGTRQSWDMTVTLTLKSKSRPDLPQKYETQHFLDRARRGACSPASSPVHQHAIYLASPALARFIWRIG
jgi:hypothetical protein